MSEASEYQTPEHAAPTVDRTRLVTMLRSRRDNDVYVVVPLPGGGERRHAIRDVRYDAMLDVIDIVTEPDLDTEDGAP